jgi:hypothetical protein
LAPKIKTAQVRRFHPSAVERDALARAKCLDRDIFTAKVAAILSSMDDKFLQPWLKKFGRAHDT